MRSLLQTLIQNKQLQITACKETLQTLEIELDNLEQLNTLDLLDEFIEQKQEARCERCGELLMRDDGKQYDVIFSEGDNIYCIDCIGKV